MDYELLLLNVHRDTSGYSVCFNDSIGQYLLAAYLRKQNFIAQVFTGTVLECKQVLIHEIENRGIPVVGFYAAADNVRIVSHIIKWLKSNYDVTTIVGGPQAIALNEEFYFSCHNDYVIVGEGEIPMHQLLLYVIDGIGSVKNIPQIKYYDKNTEAYVWNKCDDAVVKNLDEIPFPQIEDSLTGRLRSGKMVGIITGRGCPNQCAFCYEGTNAKKVRFRSISNVMKEIDYIMKYNQSVEYINIYDDTFTLNVERVLEFCHEMKQRNLKWLCEGHIAFANTHPDVIKTMVESGLTCIQFGIESGSDIVLDAYGKKTSKESILRAIEICKEAGIHGITGNFIIGGAKETKETLNESRILAKNMLDRAKGILEIYTVYFAPYPNTRMVRFPEEFDIEIDKELEQYNVHTMRSPVVRTTELSVLDIFKEKEKFDCFLADCYYASALGSKKSDVLQGMLQDGKRIHINPTWESAYASLNYIDVFLRHLSREEQNFDENAYIIRTFEDFVIEDGTMRTKVGAFEGDMKEVLLNASGVYTAAEVAKRKKISLKRMEEIYYELNDRCLVYSSVW